MVYARVCMWDVCVCGGFISGWVGGAQEHCLELRESVVGCGGGDPRGWRLRGKRWVRVNKCIWCGSGGGVCMCVCVCGGGGGACVRACVRAWVCCVGVWVCGCVGVWVCCVGVGVRAQVQTYMGMRASVCVCVYGVCARVVSDRDGDCVVGDGGGSDVRVVGGEGGKMGDWRGCWHLDLIFKQPSKD